MKRLPCANGSRYDARQVGLDRYRTSAPASPLVPMLARIWRGNSPCFEPLMPVEGRWLLGRDSFDPAHPDSRMSRRHCEVVHAEDGWHITDLGSANGTHVDATPVAGRRDLKRWQVLQIGRSLIVPLAAPPGEAPRITRDADQILGPGLLPAYRAVAEHAAQDRDLVLAGPSGCGIEALAAKYLGALRTGGRLTVVGMQRFPEDAAQIPAGVVLVEHTVPGHILESAPIRRALARPDLRFCFVVDVVMVEHDPSIIPAGLASRCALVVVPALRHRPEEVPWWIVDGAPPPWVVDVSFVEACLLRHWSGGIPDLVAATRRAAAAIGDAGPLMARHLDSDAGTRAGAVLIERSE